jgi:hypothetical protein
MTLDRKVPLTPVPVPETGPLDAAQSIMLCAGCVRCCTYVAVEVDAPDTPWQYDQYVWLLYHRNIWMYVEKGNHWYVQFETVCDKLSPEGRCTVHGEHPVLCKEYDARSCERRGELSDIVARFRDGQDLVRWIEQNRPRHHARYLAWFRKQHGHGAEEGAAPGAAGNGKRAAKKPPKMSYYEMPPPPESPLLGAEPAGGVVRKATSARRRAKPALPLETANG